jgi:hypothetical protein
MYNFPPQWATMTDEEKIKWFKNLTTPLSKEMEDAIITKIIADIKERED